MLKKYRCPHCGEECMGASWVPTSKRWLSRRRHSFPKYTSCPKCKGDSMVFIEKKLKVLGDILSFLTLLVTVAFLWLVFLNFRDNIGIMIVAFLFFAIFPFFVINPIIAKAMKLTRVQYDKKTDTTIRLAANAAVQLDSSKKINPRGIYGVKFENEIKSTKFKESFQDGLVPVVFYTKKHSDPNITDVTIMKHELVPKELLTEKVYFSVIDNKKVIAKGEITKLMMELAD